MSDSFITLVPINVSESETEKLSLDVISFLTEREIISDSLTHCVLAPEDLGYPPGQQYGRIIRGHDVDLLRLSANGIQIKAGRQVFDNGENGLEEINCPVCNANNIEAEWGEEIDGWQNNLADKVRCSQCGTSSSIAMYEFSPTWGFGHLGIVFWNWPMLTDDFLEDLKNYLSIDIRVVYGSV